MFGTMDQIVGTINVMSGLKRAPAQAGRIELRGGLLEYPFGAPVYIGEYPRREAPQPQQNIAAVMDRVSTASCSSSAANAA